MERKQDRRQFLTRAALAGAGLVAGGLGRAADDPPASFKSRMGLALYTVRDIMADEFEPVLAKIAAIGYREIEPASGYNNMEPKAFRALLDRYGLSMPSTHTNYPDKSGAELERQLEAQQVMGIRYTEIRTGETRPAPRKPPAPLEPGAYYNPATGVTSNSFKELGAFGPNQPRVTLEATKRRAANLNANGRIAGKFGIRLFVHNHTGEFEKLLDTDQTEWDVLLAETDPELVVMQLDIGWTSIAGLDPVELFNRNPGRYQLWHIKDVFGIRTVNPSLTPNERTKSMAFAPVGAGQLDYKRMFANAKVAGLKHFVVEQDNAACFGDSLAAARLSYQNLGKVLGSL